MRKFLTIMPVAAFSIAATLVILHFWMIQDENKENSVWFATGQLKAEARFLLDEKVMSTQSNLLGTDGDGTAQHNGSSNIASKLKAPENTFKGGEASEGRHEIDGSKQQGTRSMAQSVMESKKQLARHVVELSVNEFIHTLKETVVRKEISEILALLDRTPRSEDCVDSLRFIISDPNTDDDLRRFAAEAMVRIGSADSVQYVLGQVLESYRSGDEERASLLQAALEAPTTSEGMQVMFDFLLRRGSFAETSEDLPAKAVSATRKALLASRDRQEVGHLAAKLYVDSEVNGNDDATWELFDGLSSPIMLTRLAALAYEENLLESAEQFLDRLGESDNQGIVQAIVQMVPNQSVPLDAAAMGLYEWSLRHPRVAQPGLFIQYMSDRGLPPEQRIVAAFGLAGSSNPEYAQQALEKALGMETDPVVRANLQTALMVLNQVKSE